MNCPRCQSATSVVDSRGTAYGVRRRRACLTCGFKFTTYERSDAPAITEGELRELRRCLETVLARLDARSRRRFEAEPRTCPPLDVSDEVLVEMRGEPVAPPPPVVQEVKPHA